MKKVFLISLLAVSLSVASIPMSASAALTDAQIQAILSLLKSFGADQAAVINVESSLRGVPPTVTPNLGSSSAVCNFSRDLTVRSSGEDVKCLQNFLKVTPSSGYFGNLTKQALANWQSKNGISPASGYFGPLTRKKMSAILSSSEISQSTSPIPPPPSGQNPTPAPTQTPTPTLTTNDSVPTPTPTPALPATTPTPTQLPTPTPSPTPTPTPTTSPTPTPTPTPTPLPPTPPAENLIVNVSQISFAELGITGSGYYVDDLSYIAAFKISSNESIIIDNLNFTFDNSNPLARLYNVDLNGINLSVIGPGTPAIFKGEKTLNVTNQNFYIFILKSNSSETGWNITLNSLSAKRKDYPSMPVTLTGLPINVVQRNRTIKLELSPSTLTGLIAPDTYGKPYVLKLNVINDFRRIAINSVKLLLEGETITDAGKSNIVTASVIDRPMNTYIIKQAQFTSGLANSNTAYMYNINFQPKPNLEIQLELPNAKPGTKWKATLMDIGYIDQDTGQAINETGLPISNEIGY